MAREKLYLMEGFDLAGWIKFRPSPCLFRTKAEANKYIAANETENLKFAWIEVKVGNIGDENEKGN